MKRYTLDDVRAVCATDGRAIVRQFKDECCTEKNPREGGTRALELYLAFVQWCSEQGYPAITFWRWSQHFSLLVPRLGSRVGGTRYRCTNDYGGVDFHSLHTADPVSTEKLPEQWAREQGIWLVDESPGWQAMTPQWIRSIQLEGRLQAPTLHLVVIKGGAKKMGETVEVPNGAPAAEVIVDALKLFGVEVTIAGAPSASTPRTA